MTIRQNPRIVFAHTLKELALKRTLDEISVQEIANLSGYSRKNFYYHFQDKYALAEWTFNYEGDLLIKEKIDQSWPAIISQFLHEFRRYRKYYAALFSDQSSFPMVDTYCAFIIRAMKEYILHKDTKAQLELLEFYLVFVAYANTRLVKDWLMGGCKEIPEDLAEKLVSAFPQQISIYFQA